MGQDIQANSVSWLVNPSYKITDDVLAYFSLGVGEKSGAVQFNTITGQPLNVLPEETRDYEVGFRTSWLDHKLTFNPNVFYQTVDDYQQVLAAPYPTSANRPGQYYSYLGNVPQVRVQGVELDGSYLPPVNGLRFTYSGSYNDAIYASFPDAPNAADNAVGNKGTQNLSGRGLPNAPRWIGFVGSDYTAPLPPTLAGVNLPQGISWYAFASQTWRSAANLDGLLSAWGMQSAYGLTNAGIGIRSDDGKWDFSLWGKNIANTHYYVALTPATSTTPTTGTAGDPVTIGVTFRTKW
jgi:iron complex outermembrane receptor protein